MIFAIGMLLIFLGMMGTTMDLFVPVTDVGTAQLIGVANLFGLMFILIGYRLFAYLMDNYVRGKNYLYFHRRHPICRIYNSNYAIGSRYNGRCCFVVGKAC